MSTQVPDDRPVADDAAYLPEPVLPEPVRQRVIALVAAALTGLPADELPVPLRRVAKFAPNRRARLAGTAIATQLSGDPLFRQRLAGRVLEEAGDLGAAVLEGACPAAADPVEVAALAYLGRPAGWTELVEAAGEIVRAEAESAAMTELLRDAEQRAARAEHDRAVARVEADKLRDELARLREEAAGLREENRTLNRALRDAQAREKRAAELVATEKGRLNRTLSDHDAELRRLRARLAEAEATAGANRQSAKEARALDADDPARLDQLLALPKAHLIVDGYNVTKTGFPEISLEQQRSRLISGLGGIAAQTRAEITAVFDGAERVVGPPATPRGVRVLFSPKGTTADELIRRLVRAEPAGRPIIVISADREVADGVRRHGAYPLSSTTLLRRLGRV